jgi:hypothetical protein
MPAGMVLTLWRFQLSSLQGGAQGRQESNPHHAALETAVLPLNYVPKGKRVKKNRSPGIPESGSCQSPYRRYTGTRSLPKAREMPGPAHMVARLGRDHR